jgi:hypothetical protein
MKRVTTAAVLALVAAWGACGVAGCGTSPEFVEDVPEPPAEPFEANEEISPEAQSAPRMEAPPCGMSSKAVQSFARRSHNGAVEGFESRTCPAFSQD